MRPRSLIPSILMAAALFAGQAPVPNSGASHLASALANDARDVLRDPSVSPDLAARQATVLLQFSVRLDPSDLHAQKLLAESARISGKPDVQKEALRAIIHDDSGDLVAQVRYIDLLAGNSQNLEDRAKIYNNALQQSSLDAQIRSEMALRLARIAQERGDNDQAKQFLAQSIKLNDVNIGALRDMVRMAGTDTSPNGQVTRVKAIAALLTANPYQHDAWIDAARICEAANLPDRATELLNTALDQLAADGYPPDAYMSLELTLQQAIAGQAQAYENSTRLADLPDAPLDALLIAHMVAVDRPTSSRAGQAQTAATLEKLLTEIRLRLARMVKEDPDTHKSPPYTAYADAAGIALTMLPTPGPDVSAWIDAYTKEAGAEDATVSRLRGWNLYRQGKLPEAQEVLEKVSSSDPLAQLGLARILIDQNKKAAAGSLLQDLWGTHPSGLLELQIAQTARRAGVKLADTSWSAQVREAAAKLTPAIANMHRSTHDVVLMTAGFRKNTVGFGEAEFLGVRLTNTTDHAQPVGRDGVIKTTVGLGAALRGSDLSTGLYAVEDFQRVYRLLPYQYVEGSIQVDQGAVSDVLQQNPEKTLAVNVVVVTAPRILGGSQFSAGLGGQVVRVGDFQRAGFAIAGGSDAAKLMQEMNAMTGEKKLARIEAACAYLEELAQSTATDPQVKSTTDDIKGQFVKALVPLAASSDVITRAALARCLPSPGVDEQLDKIADSLISDSDPLVRLMSARRQDRLAHRAGPAAEAAVSALESRAKAETDGLIKEWLSAAIPAAREASTRPANTQPATQPATQPGK